MQCERNGLQRGRVEREATMGDEYVLIMSYDAACELRHPATSRPAQRLGRRSSYGTFRLPLTSTALSPFSRRALFVHLYRSRVRDQAHFPQRRHFVLRICPQSKSLKAVDHEKGTASVCVNTLRFCPCGQKSVCSVYFGSADVAR